MTPQPCAVPTCDAPAAGRGLCKRHHQQWRRHTAPQPHPTTPTPGAVDGHGHYGILERDNETVLCHECGQRLKSLGVHLKRIHNMTAAEYRKAHGLAWNQSLMSIQAAQKRSQIARANYPQIEQALVDGGRGAAGQRKPTPPEALTLAPKPPGAPKKKTPARTCKVYRPGFLRGSRLL